MFISASRSPAPLRLCALGLLCALVTLFTLMTPATVQTFAEGPFPGSTGGFGEPTCQQCHLGNDINDPKGTLELKVPDTFTPGQRYEISVMLSRSGLERGGFQLSARVADGPAAGTDAGKLDVSGPLVQIVKSDDGKVTYVQHTPEGTRTSGAGSLKWTFHWVAPDKPAAVRFDLAANASNNDESPMDDYIYTKTSQLKMKNE